MMWRDALIPITCAALVGAFLVFIHDVADKRRADDFACGYSYGTKDAVAFSSPALRSRPEFQLPKYCNDVADLAEKAGVVRIIPWLKGAVK